MVFLEIVQPLEIGIQWVIREAAKIGNIKTLEEAVNDPAEAVIVAKVREIRKFVKGDDKERQGLSSLELILKEVYKDGSYGSKFKAVLFGNVCEILNEIDICIGDRLIFLRPFISCVPGFKKDPDLLGLQLECGNIEDSNEKLIFVKKKIPIEPNSSSEKKIPQTNKEKVDDTNDGVINDDTNQNAQNDLQTQSFSEKQITGSDFKVPSSGVNFVYAGKGNMKISNVNNYIYKKIADIKEAENKVNAFVVVSTILRVKQPEGTRKGNITFKAVDESCSGKQHLVVCVLFEENDTFYDSIRPYTIVRVHRMKVDHYNGQFEGKVFRGSDVLIFSTKTNNGCAITSAKTCTFTDNDRTRVNELRNWVKQVFKPSQNICEKYWQSLNEVCPDKPFYMHCVVDSVMKNSVSNTLGLRVSDGYWCMLRLYHVPDNAVHWMETLEHFESYMRTVDVFVENPSEGIQKVKQGDYIVLGPIKLKECNLDPDPPKCYKMELEETQNSVRKLESTDSAVERIKKRFRDEPASEYEVAHFVNHIQKEGVSREKRKLFTTSVSLEKSPEKKSKLSPTILNGSSGEQLDSSSKDVRIRSPFEDEIFFNSTLGVPNDVYAENPNHINSKQTSRKSSDVYPSKQMLNLKRKLQKKDKKIVEVPVVEETPMEIEENEKQAKDTVINELKTKRIDTMSQESVEKYFQVLETRLNKYVAPKTKSSPTAEDGKQKISPKPIENKIAQIRHGSSSSISSVMIVENVAESEECSTKKKNSVSEDKDKTFVLKLIQLPPGVNSKVIVKDNIIQVEMGEKGVVDDAENITLLSLIEALLHESKMKKGVSITARNKNKIKNLKSSVVSKATILRKDHSKENPTSKPIARKKSIDVIDLCDACTLINEKVQNKNALDVVSLTSTPTLINHVRPPERHDDEHSISEQTFMSVRDWVENTDFTDAELHDMTSPIDSSFLSAAEGLRENILHPNHSLCQLKVFFMDVQPHFTENHMDLISGYCFSGCHKLYLFSTLVHIDEEIICPECCNKGVKNEVFLTFALQLRLMDQEGTQLFAVLFKEDAEQFLDCSLKAYINSSATRTATIEKLSRLKYDINNTVVPILSTIISSVESQTVFKNTKILIEKI